MPIRDETRHALERDQRAGELPAELDLDALHAALNSLVYGYVLFRDRFAREMQRPVRELDEGVSGVLGRLLQGLGGTRTKRTAGSEDP